MVADQQYKGDDMSLKEQIGKELRKERIKRGLTQTALATKLNMPREQISISENGRRNLTLNTLEYISRGLTGKVPRFVFFNKDNELINVKTALLEIKEIKPIIEGQEISESFDLSLTISQFMESMTIFDVKARVDFWEAVLRSGILNGSSCHGLEMIISPRTDSESVSFFISSIFGSSFENIAVSDERINAVYEIGKFHLIDSCRYNKTTGAAEIIFNAKCVGTIESDIRKAISEDRQKIEEAKNFIAANPDGFAYVCYDRPLYYDKYDDEPLLGAVLVHAWSADTAKRKYLLMEKDERLSDFFYNEFVEQFALYVINGDIWAFLEETGNKAIKNIAEDITHELFQDTGEIIIDSETENKITETIMGKFKDEELFDVFGYEDFERFWVSCVWDEVCAQLTSDQTSLMPYVMAALVETGEVQP